jgi:hypothetical protein
MPVPAGKPFAKGEITTAAWVAADDSDTGIRIASGAAGAAACAVARLT